MSGPKRRDITLKILPSAMSLTKCMRKCANRSPMGCPPSKRYKEGRHSSKRWHVWMAWMRSTMSDVPLGKSNHKCKGPERSVTVNISGQKESVHLAPASFPVA